MNVFFPGITYMIHLILHLFVTVINVIIVAIPRDFLGTGKRILLSIEVYFFIISFLLLYQFWWDKTQRMCNCTSNSRYIKIKGFENIRVQFSRNWDWQERNTFEIEKNTILECSQKLLKGSLEIVPR